MKVKFRRDYPYCGTRRFRSGDEAEAFDSYDGMFQGASGSYPAGFRILKVRDSRGQVWLVEENYDAVVIEVPVEAPE